MFSAASKLTRTGAIMGTPAFISPEQIRGGEVTGRSDLYSLGCVLYLALSGREPYAADDAVKTLFLHLEGEVPPLAEIAPEVPAELSDLVLRTMSRDPAERPASAAEMLETLDALRRAA